MLDQPPTLNGAEISVFRRKTNPPTPLGSLACESLSGRNPRFLSLPLENLGHLSGGGYTPPGYFDFGGFEPNLCSTKVTPRASQGQQAAPRSPQEDRHFQTFFWVARVSEKSALLGTGSVDSLPLWGAWAKSLFNKDCPQSFPGPPSRPKEPTRAPTFSKKIRKKTRTKLRSQNLIFWI